MKIKTHMKKPFTVFLLLILLGMVCTVQGSQKPLEQTEFEILSVKGGFGQVSLEVKNIGSTTAEDIEFVIIVTGGLFNRIEITKICTGCSDCSTVLESQAIKKESTAESQYFFGFGPLDIYVSADASNAQKVEQNLSGFIFGCIVVITG